MKKNMASKNEISIVKLWHIEELIISNEWSNYVADELDYIIWNQRPYEI